MSSESQSRLDIRERGRSGDGQPVFLDRRLFVQFFAFGNAGETASLVEALANAGLPAVLYEDFNDPLGVALLVHHEEPDFFLRDVRPFLHQSPFGRLAPKPEYTMTGRTYALGSEPDLEEALIRRPQQKLCDPALSWAIWYPLRRRGTFAQVPPEEQRTILMEHGGVGHAYGRAGYGTDIRLACYGLDQHDNDFVIGLLGPDLFPLSSIVERMRLTKQTSLHIERMGPFFVGKVVWQQGATR